MIDDDIKQHILDNKPYYKSNVLTDLYSFSKLEELINLRPFVNSARFLLTNNQKYEWEHQAWLTDVNSWPPGLLNMIMKNQVCYITDCSRVNKKINDLCKELEDLTDLPTDAHLYFDLNKNIGHQSHWDNSTNMIVQVEGETQFKIWDKYYYEPSPRTIDNVNEKPIMDITMKPGDVIIIPKNILHQANSITKRLSISFPMAEDWNSPKQERTWVKL